MFDPKAQFSPKPEGMFDPSREHDDRGQGDDVVQGLISQSTTLQDLAKSWVLFSPGLLFTHLPLPVDPVQDYINSCTGETNVVKIQLPQPIFRGTGTGGWDSTLMMCTPAFWEAGLKRHLQNLAIQDNDRQLFYRTFGSTVKVPDVLQLAHLETLPSVIPTVSVEFIGYATQHRVVTAVPSTMGHEPSCVKTFDPTGDDVLMALTALAGQPVQASKPRKITQIKCPKIAGPITPEWIQKMKRTFRDIR